MCLWSDGIRTLYIKVEYKIALALAKTGPANTMVPIATFLLAAAPARIPSSSHAEVRLLMNQ